MNENHSVGIAYGSLIESETFEEECLELRSQWRIVLPGKRRVLDAPVFGIGPDTVWLGFWVAVADAGIAERHDAAFLERLALPLSSQAVCETFPASYKSARARWRKFARFALAHRFSLDGRLLFVAVLNDRLDNP